MTHNWWMYHLHPPRAYLTILELKGVRIIKIRRDQKIKFSDPSYPVFRIHHSVRRSISTSTIVHLCLLHPVRLTASASSNRGGHQERHVFNGWRHGSFPTIHEPLFVPRDRSRPIRIEYFGGNILIKLAGYLNLSTARVMEKRDFIDCRLLIIDYRLLIIDFRNT